MIDWIFYCLLRIHQEMFFSAVPPAQLGTNIPQTWQDTWIIGMLDQSWILSSNSLEIDGQVQSVLEATTFLGNSTNRNLVARLL